MGKYWLCSINAYAICYDITKPKRRDWDDARKMKLSTAQTIYLRWISQDKSLLDIAEIEKQHVKEIQQQLDAALVALNVTSVPAAVEKAKSLKLI